MSRSSSSIGSALRAIGVADASGAPEPGPDAARDAATAALHDALDALDAMRRAEGAA